MSASSAGTPVSARLDNALFDRHVSELASDRSPAWWLEAKKAAWDRFNALPSPARTDERWRFSSLGQLKLDTYVGDAPPPAGLTASGIPPFAHSSLLAFANEAVLQRSPLPDELQARGVVFSPLEDAIQAHAKLFQAWFQKYPVELGSEKFVALNAALTASGAVLYVPDGVEVALPFVVQHHLSGEGRGAFPHTLVILGAGAKASLVEFFVGADEGRHLVSGVNDLHAGPGARLTYVGVQAWSAQTLAFQSNSIAVERDARITSLTLHLGGRQARHESHSRLLGPGAHSEMLALTVASGEQEFDQRTLQTHAAPHTSSNLLYKNALLDQAKTIFSGLIVVEPDAQKTDAYQSNRNLMLSDSAEANSLPGLEIQANDVRCTHGATTSRVEPEQLFYLQARGIPSKEAHELLIFGFFEEVLDKIEDEALHGELSQLIQAKFRPKSDS